MKRFFSRKSRSQSLVRPTLLVHEQRARTNIQRMNQKAQASKVTFRPHFKTHQSAQIGEWFRDAGVEKITVSSLTMADYFTRHGWKDITVAFPLNIREKKLIQKLARQIQLNVLVESEETIDFLNTHIETEMGIWIKVDVGYHRTGIRWDDGNTLRLLAQQIRNTPHRLEGLLTHVGQAYQARGKSQLIEIYKDSVRKINHARDRLALDGISPLKISYGDTPTCSAVDHFEGVDEIRPGNFVFYDIMQWQIGSCREEDIACALVCPVVAKHPERQELLIHGGAVHFSKEFIMDKKGQKIFGYLAHWNNHSWGGIISGCWVSALSQEHGIIHAHSDLIQNIRVGDLLAIIPIHSCLAMNLMKESTIVIKV